jgi:hypothetical protein
MQYDGLILWSDSLGLILLIVPQNYWDEGETQLGYLIVIVALEQPKVLAFFLSAILNAQSQSVCYLTPPL